MNGYILDWCTTLNLYCGWGGLHHLNHVLGPWFISGAAMRECQYARDYDSNGVIVNVLLSPTLLQAQCQLASISVRSPQEQQLFIDLASVVDDGEAECIAIAKARGYTVCSDDKAAQIEAGKLAVPFITTAQILQAWVTVTKAGPQAIKDVILRIESLGRFRPHKSSPDLTWWLANR